jgi:hypothetical protein
LGFRYTDAVALPTDADRSVSPVIGGAERRALFALALSVAVAAGKVVTEETQHYAQCAVILLKAAIGDPITLAQAQSLLERWTPIGTPLEQNFSEALAMIKSRRSAVEKISYVKGQS